jgi:small subunit ribosomal protein S16
VDYLVYSVSLIKSDSKNVPFNVSSQNQIEIRLSKIKKYKNRRKKSMVRIRLRRQGLKGQPTYRIIAADKESPRDGRFLEILGFYNPRTEPSTISIQEDRVFDWMSKGAQPSDSVGQIFRTVGLMERFDRFKKGESMDVLKEEAEKIYAIHTSNQKTNPA